MNDAGSREYVDEDESLFITSGRLGRLHLTPDCTALTYRAHDLKEVDLTMYPPAHRTFCSVCTPEHVRNTLEDGR